MSDLIQRLRDEANDHAVRARPWAAISCREAADEIERLRAALAAPPAAPPVPHNEAGTVLDILQLFQKADPGEQRTESLKRILHRFAAAQPVPAATAQPAPAAVPAGWRWVPVEATPQMAEAFDAAHHRADFRHESYRAMLAAAPQQAPTPHAGEKL